MLFRSEILRLDIPQVKMLWLLPDIRWQLTEDSVVTEKQVLILSAVWYSDAEQSLQKNISIREFVSWSAAVFRPEAIPTEKDRRCIQQRLLLRSRNLQRAKLQATIMPHPIRSRTQHHLCPARALQVQTAS